MPEPAVVEAAKSGRSGCKTCRDKIEKAAVRVGVEVTHPQYGVSNQWHHASCFDFSAKQVPDIQGIAGFDGLAPNQQAELEGLAGNKGKGKAAAAPKAAAAAAADVVDLAGSPSSAKKAKKERKKHPTQLDEEGPIERGVARIEYATAKKPSNCKACDGKIQNGEPRVGVTYPSPFYEGLSRISQMKGWDRMGYDASLEIRTVTNEVMGKKKEAQLKKAMAPLDELQDLVLSNIGPDVLKDVLKLNGISTGDLMIGKSNIDQAVMIADGMLNGLCANCPVCECPGLVQCAGRVVCWGFLGAVTKCVYKAATVDVERYSWKMSAEMVEEEWLADWMKSTDIHFITVATSNKRKAEDTAPILLPNQKVAKLKESAGGGGGGPAAPAKKRKPKREIPMEGSPILEVHASYMEHTGNTDASVYAIKGEVYNAMMQDVSLSKGVNRYYVIQVIKRSNGDFEFFRHDGSIQAAAAEEDAAVAMRYLKANPDAKVYTAGMFQIPGMGRFETAVEMFKGWYLKKTGNEWDQRHNFVQKPGKYQWVELSTVNKDVISQQQGGAVTGPCSLEKKVADLVEMLFDENNILNSMKESGVNLEEMPLGAVTAERVDKAREIILKIKQHLETAPEPATGKKQAEVNKAAQAQRVWDSQLERFSTDFFLQIPAAEPMTISDQDTVDQKIKILNMLSDIALTQKLLKQKTKKKKKGGKAADGPEKVVPHPLDDKYASLSCKMSAVKEDTTVYSLVASMLANSGVPLTKARFLCGFKGGGKHGSKNSAPPKLLQVFDMQRDVEPFTPLGNHRMLWHGTDVATAAAICATGLRIMPNSGGRVGKGIYLADEANKSGYYVTPTASGVGVMFLAEAAMGTPHLITKDSSKAQRFSDKTLPAGSNSVIAIGKSVPDPEGDVHIEVDGNQVLFPTGKLVKRPAKELGTGAAFEQTEYLVYKEEQARLRYLVLVKLW